MFKILLDDKVLQAKFSDLEITQLPFATVGAINDALFKARDAWRNAVGEVFDKPTNLTLNAVLYEKATKAKLYGELFLRKEADKGTPPSRYLEHEVKGGDRDEKPFEYWLRNAGIIGADEYVTPARGFPLDAAGNVHGGVVNAVLADLRASPEEKAHATRASQRKRERRKNINRRQVYFVSRGKGTARGFAEQHLPRGIYERTRTAFGSSVRMVFAIVSDPPSYRARFAAVAIAERAFHEEFPKAFKKRLAQGVLTARIR